MADHSKTKLHRPSEFRTRSEFEPLLCRTIYCRLFWHFFPSFYICDIDQFQTLVRFMAYFCIFGPVFWAMSSKPDHCVCLPLPLSHRALSNKSSMVNWHGEYFNIKRSYFEASKKCMQQNSHVKVFEIDSFFYVFVMNKYHLCLILVKHILSFWFQWKVEILIESISLSKLVQQRNVVALKF